MVLQSPFSACVSDIIFILSDFKKREHISEGIRISVGILSIQAALKPPPTFFYYFPLPLDYPQLLYIRFTDYISFISILFIGHCLQIANCMSQCAMVIALQMYAIGFAVHWNNLSMCIFPVLFYIPIHFCLVME